MPQLNLFGDLFSSATSVVEEKERKPGTAENDQLQLKQEDQSRENPIGEIVTAANVESINSIAEVVNEGIQSAPGDHLEVQTTVNEPVTEAPFKEPIVSKNFVGKISESKKAQKKKTGELQQFVYNDGVIGVKIKAKPLTTTTAPVTKKEKPVKLPQKRGRKSFKEIDAESDLIELPDDETLFQKQYYPISEVAKWFRVNTSLVRFWSNEFNILKPRKNRKGDRLFRPEDVKNLQLIYQLLRVRKFSIDGARDFIKANKRKADMQLQLTQTLQKFKSFLLELKTNLQS